MKSIRSDFPLLNNQKKPFVYLDNAATTHKPQAVIDAISHFYAYEYGPVDRGIYSLAERATQKIIDARAAVANFIKAHSDEIVFTKGTTEGLNFVASAWGFHNLKAGDEIVLTQMEHHSNLLPWMEIAKKTGSVIKFIPVTSTGELDYTSLDTLITSKTRIIAVIHVSNALGTHNDVKKIIPYARAVGAAVLLDSCQAVVHQDIDVQELDVDFLTFSGHKMFGPTGVGVLYIRRSMHDRVPPYQYGGGMVYEANYERYSWLSAPKKYEAGTLPIAEIIGLHTALVYIKNNVDFKALVIHEATLIKNIINGLRAIHDVRLLGPLHQLEQRGHLISFTVDQMHSHDVAAYLDHYGIMVRSGHYCAQPLAKKMGIDGSLRVSVAAYNNQEEISYFLTIMHKLMDEKPFNK